MNKITKKQIISIHTLLQQCNLIDDKARIITEASGGRCSSSKELYYDEAQTLINYLNASKPKTEDARKKMFGNIIAMAHEIGFVKTEKVVVPGAGIRTKNNYSDLHSWINKYGYLHKPMNDYSYEELPKLVTQFKELYRSKMNVGEM